MKRHSSLLLLALLGCSGSPTPTSTSTPVTTLPKVEGKTESEPDDPDSFSLAALKAPAKVQIDGDIAEWGSLLPLPKPPKDDKKDGKKSEKKDDKKEPKGGEKKAPPPSAAASHVAVAITDQEALIAAELGESATRSGFFLGLGDTPPDVARIGEWGRGNQVWEFECEYEHTDISDGDWVRGERNPPEVIAACEQLKVDHEEYVRKNSLRFECVYKIDASGIKVFSEGSLRPVEGAKVARKPRGKGSTVEVSLPLKALPRMADAPLKTLQLSALVALVDDLVGTLQGQAGWDSIDLPEPAFFNPHGELRAKAFEHTVFDPTVPSGLSYQPGDPMHVEVLGYEGNPSAITPVQKTLYEKFASLGDVDVVHVPADGLSVGTIKAGKFVDLFPVEFDYNFERPLKAYGTVERGDELHVFLYYDAHYSGMQGPMAPAWVVVAIGRDGKVRNAAEECNLPWANWEKTWEYVNDDKSSLGFRGPVYASGDEELSKLKKPGLEVKYTWDPKSKGYACLVKPVNDPKPPTAKEGSSLGQALADLSGLMKRPSNWAGLREITVTGSSALACVTQVQGPKNGGWFRAHCTGDKVLDVKPLRGHRKTQTAINVTPTGTAEIFTPVAEGTEVSFKMKFEKAGDRTMTIRWKKGQPKPAGVIEK